jgi:hypothetical protein
MTDVWYVVYTQTFGTTIDRLRSETYPNGLPTSFVEPVARNLANILAARESWTWFQLYRGIDALREAGYT